MQRRMPVLAAYSTARKEADEVEIVSGFFNGYTTGTPLTGIIRNKDAHSADYEEMTKKTSPFPCGSHRHDKIRRIWRYPRRRPFFRAPDRARSCLRAASPNSGLRDSASISAHTYFLSAIRWIRRLPTGCLQKILLRCSKKKFPVLDDQAGKRMLDAIAGAKELGDSLGGVIECIAIGVPAGLGDPIFDSVESVVSGMLFSIPAVKGVEFGAGFTVAQKKGKRRKTTRPHFTMAKSSIRVTITAA